MRELQTFNKSTIRIYGCKNEWKPQQTKKEEKTQQPEMNHIHAKRAITNEQLNWRAKMPIFHQNEKPYKIKSKKKYETKQIDKLTNK